MHPNPIALDYGKKLQGFAEIIQNVSYINITNDLFL